MKRKLTLLFAIILITGTLINCKKQNMAQALSLQNPIVRNDEYYANIRAYKKSKHQIFYGWFAAYANKEGVIAEYKKSPSWGEHIAGLPDSLDFCSLWMGIPSNDSTDTVNTYNPIAYAEMRKSMEQRAIKMVVPEICRIQKYNGKFTLNDQGIRDYATYLVKMILDNKMDGLDLDYEPNNGSFVDYINGSKFATLVQYIADSIGPKGKYSDKYLIVDYYQDAIPSSIEPYINYLVNQAYTQGTTTTSATFLQGRYNTVNWCPTSKFIVTENFGQWWATGGSPFTEANGNTLTKEGRQMTSMEGMARWNPTQGKKAGWGAFYFDRDYNNLPPYNYVRRSIQIVNPAVH